MKIIRPVDISESVESNAPGDGHQVWEPEGRENLFSGNQMSLAGDTAYVVNSNQSQIDYYSLASSEMAGGFTGVTGDIQQVAVSPDEAYLAFIEFVFGNYNQWSIYVIDLATVQTVYSDTLTGNPAEDIGWSSDSAHFYYAWSSLSGDGNIYITNVPSANWQAPATSPNLLTESGIAYDAYAYRGSAIDASGNAFVSCYVRGSSDRYFIVKVSASGSISASALLGSSIFTQGVYINQSRGEVFAYGDSPHAGFDQATLASVSVPSALAGGNIKNIAPSKDGTELLVQSSSVQPYNRRLSATDYSSLTAFPATENYADAQYADDYAVFLRSDGTYDIVELAANTLLEQTNPTVTTGDIYTYADHNYEALTDNSDRPDIGATQDPPTWLDLGFVNPLRMFDNKLDSLTEGPSPLVIDITPGLLVNGIALFNVNATTVQITQTDPTEGVVYDTGEVRMVDASTITGWYEFFFGSRLKKADLTRIDLLPYKDATITITLRSEGTDVSIGEIVAGRLQSLGIAQYGTSVGITDFSRKETDQFGNFVITPRRFSKRAEYDVRIPTAQNAGVQRTLAALRTTPIVWVGDPTKEETVVYGYYRDFDILLAGPSLSDGTITVEGL